MIDEGTIGHCDICGCPIFDYEKFVRFEDICSHKSCLDQEEREARMEDYYDQ